jgi:cytidylate kinase
MITVAIDGPAGAGKSTVARQVAAALHVPYIDSGAMYRAVALYALTKGIDPRDEAAVTAALPDVDLTIEGEALRTPEVGAAASVVAAYPGVRERLLHTQRAMAQESGAVMDGRDIGSHVLPDATLKVYLDASVEERARRRVKEHGGNANYEDILRQIKERDDRDRNREQAPLTRLSDAFYIETDNMTATKVAKMIVSRIALLQSKEGSRGETPCRMRDSVPRY